MDNQAYYDSKTNNNHIKQEAHKLNENKSPLVDHDGKVQTDKHKEQKKRE